MARQPRRIYHHRSGRQGIIGAHSCEDRQNGDHAHGEEKSHNPGPHYRQTQAFQNIRQHWFLLYASLSRSTVMYLASAYCPEVTATSEKHGLK